ncbi:MAG TPA: bifunctional 5,10-methylenetetrahydrofolate dehydrogenase/5,10-methenyltetrahydrofolate cyclohydrolase [Bacteroidota bacterium]|nr:bifunctional 5,10-methylenetetrahydrofolate dehydrogenase/5,10-methenyltetrahydrofolate cyclohydrolase [Bacteroidota bacterium]
MMAQIIDGKQIAEQIKAEVHAGVSLLLKERQVRPGLGVVLVGEDPASQSYVRSKGKACEDLGMYSETRRLPASATEAEVLSLVRAWNDDASIHGILVQLPLPRHINEHRIIAAIDPRKDVDGIHPTNIGRLVIGMECFKPCTPAGIQELLVRSGHDPGGKHVVVVGRSNIVGKPMVNILMQKAPGANAIVTIAHTAARDLGAITREADILIAALGKAECVTGAMLKPGCVVIDVGINRVPDPALPKGYRLVGDVHFASAEKVAAAITPVPGGVGPMTIAMLMQNTLLAAQRLTAE